MFTVMIVDDFKIFRKQITRMKLWEEQERFQIVAEARNGEDALKKLRKRPVSLVITDIKMPKVNGIELIKTIKDEKLCRCVVLLSEYADFEYARQGLVLGAFDYLVKPIDSEKMTTILERCYDFLLSHRDDEYPYFEEKAIMNAILDVDVSIGEKINRFLTSIYHLAGRNTHKMAIMAVEAIKNISTEVLKKEPWIDKFVKNIRVIEWSIMRCEEHIEINRLFEEYMIEMYAVCEKYRRGTSEIVKKACIYIVEHSDEKLSLGEVATECFANRTYLSHIFKQEANMAFSEYVKMVKCERAKKLMEETDFKIFEVAAILKYDDTEYFSRIFKGYAGKSPSEYKKRVIKQQMPRVKA